MIKSGIPSICWSIIRIMLNYLRSAAGRITSTRRCFVLFCSTAISQCNCGPGKGLWLRCQSLLVSFFSSSFYRDATVRLNDTFIVADDGRGAVYCAWKRYIHIYVSFSDEYSGFIIWSVAEFRGWDGRLMVFFPPDFPLGRVIDAVFVSIVGDIS